MSAQNYDSHRPRTIAELAAVAQQNIWDPSRPLKHWLRTAEKSRKTGGHYVETRDYESAFIEFARAATIVLERLPSHSEYNTLLNADQRANLVMVSVISTSTIVWYTPYVVLNPLMPRPQTY